jgi:membrane protease subunit HflK
MGMGRPEDMGRATLADLFVRRHRRANDQIPRARGEASQTVSSARNYKQQRIAEAVGNTTRFLALLTEYQKAPEVTRSRLYLDSMEKILPKVKLYVIDSQGGRVPINLRVTTPAAGEK